MKTILLVEDDQILQDSTADFLSQEGYSIAVASTIAEAEQRIQHSSFDLFLLDWRLPDGNGVDLMQKLRSDGVRAPILLITAKSEVVDKVVGLEMGANDYITKPFDPRELLARIRVQMRMGQSAAEPLENLESNQVKIDIRSRKVSFQETELSLSKKEYDLLKLFLENPDQVFSRDELLNKVWGYDSYPTTRTIDAHVVQLRQKLKDEFIETVRGVGYRWKSYEL